MKRMIALSLCLLLLLTLFSGCGGSNEAQTTEAQQAVETEPAGEYNLPREINTNQLTFYWLAEGVDLSKCDMWIWYANAEERGYVFHQTSRGGKVMLNIPLDVTEVGFVVRRDCSDPGGTSWGEATRDYEADRYVTIKGDKTVVWLKPNDGAQYFSDDGGKTLIQAKQLSLATIEDMNQIGYYLTTPAIVSSLDQVKVLEGEREIPIQSLSSLNNETTSGTITLAEELDISKIYTVELEGFESRNAVPTKVFDTEAFVERYTYDGNDLGAIVRGGKTVFKLWAPTATKVRLELYQVGNGGNPINQIEMVKEDKGVWSGVASCGHGTYYTYSVTTVLGTQKVVDPYARSVGVNGDRGMVVDSIATNPEGFSDDKFYDDIDAYNEAIIWEVHVRDFSNKISGSQYPGKYLAFTETGLTNASGQPAGLDYLKTLGITHVQLQPVFDYASINEDYKDSKSSTFAKFNWGYDAKNFNAPEGSYSTDPYHGEVRVNELKQMVQALHQNGIGVVMDVAYNHTYDINCNLNKIVPYYFFRYKASGAPSNGSGSGNETASERVMFRKFMVDSVSYWAKEYHIDGFRFDMMSLHDVETMQAIEEAVHSINPKAIIYGESRTGGSTVLASGLQANQMNVGKIEATEGAIGGVAVFNDATRDSLKGSIMNTGDKGYINGNPNINNANSVIFGISGGVKTSGVNWSVENNMVINYLASHNYNTLWDKLQLSNSSAKEEARYAMNRLGEEILMLSKGTPFMLGGEEMLRTKRGESNSNKASDSINNIDWDALTRNSLQMRMFKLMKRMIAIRRANSFFSDGEVSCEVLSANIIRVTWTVGRVDVAVALINPNDDAIAAELPDGRWEVLYDGETSDAAHVGGKDVLIVTAPGVGVIPAEPVEDPDNPEETGEEATGETGETEETTEEP